MDTNTTVQSNQPKQSMNPMMIGAVVVGVVLLGGYALFANKDVSSSPQTTPTQVPQVTQKNAVTAPTSSAVSEDIKEFTPFTRATSLYQVSGSRIWYSHNPFFWSSP